MSEGYVGAEAGTSCHVTSIGGKGGGKGVDLRNRPGSAPTQGFQACKLIVGGCTNEKSNGTYFPAVPYDGKPVWQKPPPDHPMDGEESKDNGERFVYYSAKAERWFIGDALEEGGFAFLQSPGKCPMPPVKVWKGADVICEAAPSDGLDAAAAMAEMQKLTEIQPWEDQEICYVTMLKLLGNIVANPGETKFRSFKIENPAIQKKFLKFDGARGFFEAIGFREDSGALVFPTERTVAQAKLAHEMLEGFANEAQYANIRKERHAKAKEVAEKEAEKESWSKARAKASASAAAESKGGG